MPNLLIHFVDPTKYEYTALKRAKTITNRTRMMKTEAYSM